MTNNYLDIVGTVKEENGKLVVSSRILAKKLGKQHSNVIRDLENIINNFDNIILKGEFVIVVEGNKSEIDYSDLDLVEHVGMYISDGLDKMEAIKQTSKDLKLSKSEVYKKYHEGN